MQVLLDFFESNDDLKVFGMNGSKINKNIPDDIFKDYDVVFFTENVSKYKNDAAFLKRFGDILLFTEPEIETTAPLFPDGNGYIYLVQYTNGTRIDIQFRSLDMLDEYLKEDSLTEIIADKEGLIAVVPAPNDSDYWLAQPTAITFEKSVKEFWWELNNTLKATIRGEFLLAQFYLNLTREELILLMTWEIALSHGYEKNYGKKLTQVLNYLSIEEQELLTGTFDTSSSEKIYRSLQQMKQLEERYILRLGEAASLDYQELLALKKVPSSYLLSKQQPELAALFE